MKHAKQVEILSELLRQIEAGRNIDCGEQVRMSTRHYHDPEIAEREWQTFFRNHTQLVGLSGDLPQAGSYFTTSDFGVPVLAVRGRTKQLESVSVFASVNQMAPLRESLPPQNSYALGRGKSSTANVRLASAMFTRTALRRSLRPLKQTRVPTPRM